MGEVFQKVSQEIGFLQQNLMSTPGYEPSVDIYRLLVELLQIPEGAAQKSGILIPPYRGSWRKVIYRPI